MAADDITAMAEYKGIELAQAGLANETGNGALFSAIRL